MSRFWIPAFGVGTPILASIEAKSKQAPLSPLGELTFGDQNRLFSAALRPRAVEVDCRLGWELLLSTGLIRGTLFFLSFAGND